MDGEESAIEEIDIETQFFIEAWLANAFSGAQLRDNSEPAGYVRAQALAWLTAD